MSLNIVSTSDFNEILPFVCEVPNSTIYNSPSFLGFLSEIIPGEGKILVARQKINGEIVGCIPYFEYSVKGIGTVINSLPWFGSHGGCLLKNPNSLMVRAGLLNEVKSIINSKDVISANIVLSFDEQKYSKQYKEILGGPLEEPRIGQVTELPIYSNCISEEILRVCTQKTRNLVRKALKQGFTVSTGDDDEYWDYLYKTHVDNLLTIGGSPKPMSHFKSIRRNFNGNCKEIFAVKYEEKIIAAVLLLYFRDTVEYITPVISHEFRSMQPLSAAIFHAMVEASRRGYRYWNWGGTWISQKSLHHFKAGWGAKDIPYSYLICSSVEDRNIISKHRSDLTKIFPYYYLFPYDKL